VSDQQQILRLLATIREEVAGIRSRQEELHDLLISYKDQLHELKTTVVDGLSGLPKSPYIAGQLVPAPDKIDGIDDFRHLLATYLHKAPPDDHDSKPVDTSYDPPRAIKPEEIELEPLEDAPERRRGGSGGGRRHDSDLERGPDRDVEVLDLDEDDRRGGDKKRRRSRGGRRRRGAESKEPETAKEPEGD